MYGWMEGGTDICHVSIILCSLTRKMGVGWLSTYCYRCDTHELSLGKEWSSSLGLEKMAFVDPDWCLLEKRWTDR